MTHNLPPDQDLPTEVPDDLLGDLPGFAPPEVTVSLARPYLRVSLGFLAVSVLLGLIAVFQLVFPDVFSGMLSFGRVAPAATDMFLFGWLTIGLGGMLLFAVGRLGRVEPAGDRTVVTALVLLVLGVLLGTAAVLLGEGDGRPLLEYPLLVDAVLVFGMIGLAVAVSRTAGSAARDVGPTGWYAVAGAWWLVLAFVVGNIPGVSGVAGAIQIAFFRSAITGLWLAGAGVGIVYFLIPRLSGRPAFTPTRLSLLGFWSLAFVWPLTAPSSLTFGPVPDWAETVGAVFSIGLVIPALVIVTDLALALRGRWRVASGDATLGLVVLGWLLLAAYPLVNLMLALRASSGLVQFTDWVGAADAIAWYGIPTVWLAAALFRVMPELTGRAAALWSTRLYYSLTVAGLVVWLFGLMIAGVISGWSWVANANEPAIPAAGDGWVNTADAVVWLGPVKLIGFAVFAIAQLWLAVAVGIGSRTVEHPAPLVVGAPPLPPDPELELGRPVSIGLVRAGAIGLFLLSAFLAWGIPSLEVSSAQPTILADTTRWLAENSIEARGLEVYVQEGCISCHTQQVRPIVTDVGLGAVSVPGDYARDPLPLLGTMRIGPDLMHAGSREPTNDAAWVAAHLADPRAARPWSIMPAYDHLSDDELAAVAAYVTSLR